MLVFASTVGWHVLQRRSIADQLAPALQCGHGRYSTIIVGAWPARRNVRGWTTATSQGSTSLVGAYMAC